MTRIARIVVPGLPHHAATAAFAESADGFAENTNG